MRKLMLGRTRRDEQGAAAVEFALLVPILFALLFGMVDYGFLFTDTVSTRNGVRESARQGAVSNFGSCGAGTSFDKLRCQTKQEIGALTGSASVKVYVPGGTWRKGEPLVVCSIVPDPGVIKFVPMPADIRSRVEMSIENESLPPTGALSSEDALASVSYTHLTLPTNREV